MNKYGRAAILAVSNFEDRRDCDPVKAWRDAVGKVFPKSVSSQKKGCPKSAFLGLCEEGLVRGVPRGSFTRSVDNKRYALNAVHELKRNPALANNPDDLWEAVMKGVEKKHNSQMNVVIALWDQGLIV